MRGLAIGAVAALGCAEPVDVSGKVAGEVPELTEAFFVQRAGVYADGSGHLGIVLTGLSESCEVLAAVERRLDRAGDAEEAEAAWAALLPEDFWYVLVDVRVRNPGHDLSGQQLEGPPWDEGISADDQWVAEVRHYIEHLDASFWTEHRNDHADYFSVWLSHHGTLDIVSHRPDTRLEAHLGTEVATPDSGHRKGEIEIDLVAERCTALEPYFYEGDA